MNKQNSQNATAKHKELSTRTAGMLVASLVIISIFPIYVTFILSIPPEPGLIATNCVYLLALGGFISVFTGWYRPRWLILTLISLGAFNLVGLLWLYAALHGLNPSL